MKRRIAIPICENAVSPVLDTAERLMVVDTEDAAELKRTEYALEGPVEQRVNVITANADVLITGALSCVFEELLRERNIKLYPWRMGDIEPLLTAAMNGEEPGVHSMMPGCGARRRNRGHGRGRCGKRGGQERAANSPKGGMT